MNMNMKLNVHTLNELHAHLFKAPRSGDPLNGDKKLTCIRILDKESYLARDLMECADSKAINLFKILHLHYIKVIQELRLVGFEDRHISELLNIEELLRDSVKWDRLPLTYQDRSTSECIHRLIGNMKPYAVNQEVRLKVLEDAFTMDTIVHYLGA